MTLPSTSELQALRRLALKATPGPWKRVIECYDHTIQAGDRPGDFVCTLREPNARPNAEYLAALSPEVVLALVEHALKHPEPPPPTMPYG